MSTEVPMERDLLFRALQCMQWVELPLQQAMRGTNVIRCAGDPPPNMQVYWTTNYSSGQEWLALLQEMRSALCASAKQDLTP